VKAWPLAADQFMDDCIAGPVPTLFAEDPAEALASILSNPTRAHSDLQRLMRCFLTPELIDATAATKLIKTPR